MNSLFLIIISVLIAVMGCSTKVPKTKSETIFSSKYLDSLPKNVISVDRGYFLRNYDKGYYDYLYKYAETTESIDLLLDSPGGSLTILNTHLAYFAKIKQITGVKFICHAASASSAALTFMIVICDKVIATNKSVFIQHFPSFGNGNQDDTSYFLGKQLAELEMKVKNLPEDWFKRTRILGKDVTLTAKELKELGIVTEIVE